MLEHVTDPRLPALQQQLQRESSQALPLVNELLDDSALQSWRARCFCLGYLWHDEQRQPEALTQLGLALVPHLPHDPAAVISELLLGYASAREERRMREWEQRLLRRVSELDGLHRIISAANSSLDLEESLHTVAQTAATAMKTDICSIFVFDRNSGMLSLRATYGLDHGAIGHVAIRLGEGATGWAAQEGQPLVIEDVWADDRFRASPLLDERPYRSIACVPIILFASPANDRSGDQLQGVISVQARAPRAFADEDVSFLEVVAGELAFTMANAQRYQETDERLRQKVRELSTLQRVTAAVAATLDLQTVLNLIAEQAVQLSSSDRADIFEYDEVTHSIQLIASWGGQWDERLRRVILRAVQDGHPVAVTSAFDDMRFPELRSFAMAEGYHSFFCIPLRIGERMIGAIALYTQQQRYFDYEQVQLLSTFADEAAIAVENARLFKEVERNLQIKSTLLQEMHHRVRNNLQTISALLMMQHRRLDPDAPGAAALATSAGRIQAIAAVHNLLCRNDIGITTVQEIARQVADSARTGLVGDTPVQFAVKGEPMQISSREATIVALIINELINNALTHGIAAHGGRVEIEAWRDGEDAVVEVRDNGVSQTPAQSKSSSGLGLPIIETLVTADLGGTFRFERDDEWARARLRWPYAAPEAGAE